MKSLSEQVEDLRKQAWKMNTGTQALAFMEACDRFLKTRGDDLVAALNEAKLEEKDRVLEDGAQTFAGLMALLDRGEIENVTVGETPLRDYLSSALRAQSRARRNNSQKEKKNDVGYNNVVTEKSVLVAAPD